MIADTLLNWDKTELANILADKMADAEDLVEAFPSIEKASTIEEDILDILLVVVAATLLNVRTVALL